MIFLVVFLDTVVKPRYDIERVFRAMQQRQTFAGMTFRAMRATAIFG
ncbi:MAG TPA: palindromic element RPE4 domain-containing protein [Rickettsia endosymbiont of Pyrocoelia pectoralis]|nr:palindromic element RPE4 domain-containing protein [Rickettsia endosymbiont of Pyrocoelia pectoralis]